MERGIMTINRNGVTITGNVWMTDFEIAELFSVTLPAVNSRIKSIYKSGVLSLTVFITIEQPKLIRNIRV